MQLNCVPEVYAALERGRKALNEAVMMIRRFAKDREALEIGMQFQEVSEGIKLVNSLLGHDVPVGIKFRVEKTTTDETTTKSAKPESQQETPGPATKPEESSAHQRRKAKRAARVAEEVR